MWWILFPDILWSYVQLKDDTYLVNIPKTQSCVLRFLTKWKKCRKMCSTSFHQRENEMLFFNYQRRNITIEINGFPKTAQTIAVCFKLESLKKSKSPWKAATTKTISCNYIVIYIINPIFLNFVLNIFWSYAKMRRLFFLFLIK